MAAGNYSFTIEQGATTNINVVWKDSNGDYVNLTGYSARMDIRPSVGSSETYLELTSTLDGDGTGLNLNGSDGVTPLTSGSIGIYISAAKTATLDFNEAVYDLELEKSGEVTRLIQGRIQLSKEVTR